MKMDYSKMETMTKLILTCTLQFCVLFSYKLCACHMTDCHYTRGNLKETTSLNAAERGKVGEGRQCLLPRPSTVSSETDVFL